MIRRGLQITFVVGIMALGAASCFAQYDGTMPYRLTVLSGDFGFEGVYVITGQTTDAESSLGGVYQRYTRDGQPPYWLLVRSYPQTDSLRKTRMQIYVHSEYPENLNSASEVGTTIILSDVIVGPTPSLITTLIGDILIDWFPPAPPNPNAPYQEAFPDWESASVKIPLGFALGMAFWAAAVALTIPMKWIKELASAAS